MAWLVHQLADMDHDDSNDSDDEADDQDDNDGGSDDDIDDIREGLRLSSAVQGPQFPNSPSVPSLLTRLLLASFHNSEQPPGLLFPFASKIILIYVVHSQLVLGSSPLP